MGKHYCSFNCSSKIKSKTDGIQIPNMNEKIENEVVVYDPMYDF
jgi:hypothetical protein